MLIFTCLSPCNAYVPSSSARSSARRRLLASTLSVPLTLLTSPSPSFAGIDVSGLSVEGSQKSDLISQLRPYDGSAATRIQEVKEVNQPPPKPGEGGRAGCERSGRKGVASEARGRSVRSSSTVASLQPFVRRSSSNSHPYLGRQQVRLVSASISKQGVNFGECCCHLIGEWSLEICRNLS